MAKKVAKRAPTDDEKAALASDEKAVRELLEAVTHRGGAYAGGLENYDLEAVARYALKRPLPLPCVEFLVKKATGILGSTPAAISLAVVKAAMDAPGQAEAMRKAADELREKQEAEAAKARG